MNGSRRQFFCLLFKGESLETDTEQVKLKLRYGILTLIISRSIESLRGK